MFERLKTIAAALVVASAGLAASNALAQGRITIGTNPQGTLYFTIGGGIAASLQEKLQRPVTVQPYAGSSVYIPLIAAGEVTIGLNSSIDVGAWYRGDYGKEPIRDMRVLARLWPLRQAFVVRADSGMTEVKDLVGKRTVTAFSSLAAIGKVNVTMLLAGGLQEDQVEPVTVSGLKAGLDDLVEGNLDATASAVGIPLTQQAGAAIPGGIRYLSVTGENASDDFVNNAFPGVYLLEVKPNPRMPEVTEPITVAAYDVYLTTSSSLSDEDATAIVEALYDGLPQLKKDYPPLAAAAQDKLALPSNTVPYHSAAVAFYKSKGLWTEANEKRDAELGTE